jgi:cysteinyl-tRNA synthetase
VTLKIHDTATRTLREFTPLEPGKVGIYLCGATVQAPPHVGHIRSGIAFDVVRRWLTASGYEVTFIRNVTDIDDKIIHNAGHEDVEYWVVASRNERAFTDAYNALGCLPPTHEPRATGHIPEMIELMQEIIDRDHGYAQDGDVYFDVRSDTNYGSLSGQKVDDMLAAEDAAANKKRDPRDFAMWKGAKPGEPLWNTPWGPGRPGWHIECSAMARKYLGTAFDIHGGGIDLIFPHHENEIAQSKAAGDSFAQYWMHNAWVTTAGEKMSKSLGNSLLVSEVLKRIPALHLRYYLAGSHYRSMLEYSDSAVHEAGQGFMRISGFIDRAMEALGIAVVEPDLASMHPKFVEEMNNDFGVPNAIAVIHEVVREGNTNLTDGDLTAVSSKVVSVVTMLEVLGMNPLDPLWATDNTNNQEIIGELVQVAINQRKDARERKDYTAADAIRADLERIGISLEDTKDGVRWSVRPSTTTPLEH